MKDSRYPIRIFAAAGLAMQLFSAAVTLLLYLFPKPAFLLTGAPDSMASVNVLQMAVVPILMTVVHAVLYVLLYFGIDRNLQAEQQNHINAKTLMILTIIFMAVWPVVGTVVSLFNHTLIARLHGTAEYAALASVEQVSNWAGILASMAKPCLLAAAVLCWYRSKYLTENAR